MEQFEETGALSQILHACAVMQLVTHVIRSRHCIMYMYKYALFPDDVTRPAAMGQGTRMEFGICNVTCKGS